MKTRYVVPLAAAVGFACLWGGASAAASAAEPPSDPALAAQLGGDAQGMRRYGLVVLRTGPHRVPDGPGRDAMFQGHFANMQRLADAGKLAVAGPFAGEKDWRGLFVFAVEDIAEAEALVATDPVIVSGEMVAEYHRFYSSAALMAVNGIHKRIAPAAPAAE